MKINEAARLAGVTVRTLRYYDQIGLLKPSRVTEAGYRVYDAKALETLQQILFFRELDFPLREIQALMEKPGYDRRRALEGHRALLLEKKKHIEGLIALADRSLNGEDDMSFQEFDKSRLEDMRTRYAAEVQERWGDTAAYRQEQARTAGWGEDKWRAVSGRGEALMRAFAMRRGEAPQSAAVQALVGQWQTYITESFYHCTYEILSGLGAMYVEDQRFTDSIDQYGPGTAALMAEAIGVHCRAQAEK
ncbi:HTH-type transcriptional activator mta [bioreactor metagenome]|uniref:HTH-type transcriptional activator mta n=1 Tax=bioreactor metagenome TaxID=1076179 RepID=A0A645EHM4_9ZZZZ|nr:MerR family transcriptional regulator [Oscillibacter sp.]MEA4994157.1 MerR family transcriptional regulator [Oscillibacter sp.]